MNIRNFLSNTLPTYEDDHLAIYLDTEQSPAGDMHIRLSLVETRGNVYTQASVWVRTWMLPHTEALRAYFAGLSQQRLIGVAESMRGIAGVAEQDIENWRKRLKRSARTTEMIDELLKNHRTFVGDDKIAPTLAIQAIGHMVSQQTRMTLMTYFA